MKAGNLIIPRSWYSKLVNQNDKSDWLAIAILGELVYLDEYVPYINSPLNLSQSYFCKLYGSSKVCVRRALKRLEKANLIIVFTGAKNNLNISIHHEAIQRLEAVE